MAIARRPWKVLCLAVLLGVLVSCAPAPEPPAPPPPMPQMGAWIYGEAIWYGELFHGRKTTSGEAFDMYRLTGSHPSLPLGSVVEVVHAASGKTAEVVINDRTHLEENNALAISRAAAQALGAHPQRRFAVQFRWVR